MILTIICLSILVIGIVGAIVAHQINKYHPTYTTPDWLDLTFFTCIVVGIIANLCTGAGLIVNGIFKQNDYEKIVYEKTVLEYRLDELENGNSSIGNELVYNDVVEFNNELRSIKRWANNPWTSWFNNDLIADNIEYIEIPNLNNSGGGGEI